MRNFKINTNNNEMGSHEVNRIKTKAEIDSCIPASQRERAEMAFEVGVSHTGEIQ